MAGPWEKYAQSVPENLQNDAVAQEIVQGPKPWEKFDPAKKEINNVEAALQGFGQGAAFGYLPNLQAAAEPITDKIFGALTGKEVEDPRSYVQRRDAAIKRDKDLSESGAYTAGNIAGALAVPTPGTGLIKGGGLLAKTASAGLGGALAGALYNPGEKDGEASGLQLEDRANAALKGGLLGAGSQLLSSGISKASNMWANKGANLEKASNMSAVSAIGAQKGDIKKLLNKNQINSVGNFLKEEKLVGPGKTFEDAYNGAQKILKEEGPKIGEVYNTVQQKLEDPKFLESLKPDQLKKLSETTLNAPQIASELGETFAKELKGKAGGKAALSRIQGELESLAELGDNVNMKDLIDTRKSFDDLINYDKSVRDMPLAQEYLKKTRDFIQKKVNERIDALDKTVGGSLLDKLKKANKRYGSASTVFNIAKGKLAGEESKMLIGLPELLAGGAVATSGAINNLSNGDIEGAGGSLAKGLLAAAAMKGARRYGPGVATKLLDVGSKIVKKDPTAALARGASGLLNKIPPEKLGGFLERVKRGSGNE